MLPAEVIIIFTRNVSALGQLDVSDKLTVQLNCVPLVKQVFFGLIMLLIVGRLVGSFSKQLLAILCNSGKTRAID